MFYTALPSISHAMFPVLTPLVSTPMSTVTSKIAQLSANFPPIFTTSKPNTDPFISSRKNVLSIDLNENWNSSTPIQTSEKVPKQVLEDLNSVRVELEAFKASQGPVHIEKEHTSPEVLDRNLLLIYRIRKLVSEDAARQPEDRIDCVEFGSGPWPGHLRALDGLSPKHLQVDGGFPEVIDLTELDKLNTRFKLESLWISSVGTDWISSDGDSSDGDSSDEEDWSKPIPTPNPNPSSEPAPSNIYSFPEFFTHVRSLTLEYCCGLTFKGTNLPAHLRQLKIIGNNAMDMFIQAVNNMPNVSEQLEKVFIYTNPLLDMYSFWLDDFRERLGRCKGLKELTLIVADEYEARVAQYPTAPRGPKRKDRSDPFDVGLSRSLPNGIERLEFHFSNSEPMLADLDLWIEAAKDPEWLPRLKYIRICTYDAEIDKVRLLKKPAKVVDTGRDRMFSEKIRKIYGILQSRGAPVEVEQ